LGTLDEKDRMMESKEIIKEELTELLENFYDGSFAELVCDYIRSTGMTQQEVKELMEVIRKEKGA
jgi:predicted transcriptional regulator